MLLLAGMCAAGRAAASDARFDGERAMSWLRRQCALGPRIPGTAGHAALQDLILGQADSLGLAASRIDWTQPDPYGGDPLELSDLVVVAGKSRPGPRLWIAAHYDTRPVSDRDPDPERAKLPLPGANDGASGTAVLLELAELLAGAPPPRPVALIYLDGEDWGHAGDLDGYCLGSRYLAKTWNAFGSPLAGPEPTAVIVLDMVGDRELTLPFEGYSLAADGPWLRALWSRAATLGLTAFVPEPGRRIFDDHVPFLAAGLRAVDLIDFEYPAWHTRDDVPSACSAASLEQVGVLLWDLIRRPLD